MSVPGSGICYACVLVMLINIVGLQHSWADDEKVRLLLLGGCGLFVFF